MNSSSLIQYQIFGLWILQRMALRFKIFAIEESFRGYSIIDLVCSMVKIDLEGFRIDKLKIDSCIIDSITPDTEVYSGRYTSSALDAVNAASAMLSFLSSRDISLIREISDLSIQSADLLAQLDLPESSGQFLEESIRSHSLMQEEFRFQEFAWRRAGEVAVSEDIFGEFLRAAADMKNWQ